MPYADQVDMEIDNLKALPPHTCPAVDKMLKSLQQESKSAGSAAEDAERHSRNAEDGTTERDFDQAQRALESASEALDDAARALDEERDIAALLRSGCDQRESIARYIARAADEKIEGLEQQVGTLEEEALNLQLIIEEQKTLIEAQRADLHTKAQVILYLGSQIKKSWWRKLADTTRGLFWKTKAKARARKIERMRRQATALRFSNVTLFDALMMADGLISQQEWRKGPFGENICPECGVTDTDHLFRDPRHRRGCKRGEVAEAVRWALRVEARAMQVDPNHVTHEAGNFKA